MRFYYLDLRLTGKWIRQYFVIMGFYFFDYLSTLYHIDKPSQEWNFIARHLMIYFNDIFIGMTAFIIILSLFFYLLHILWSSIIEKAKIENPKKWKRLTGYNLFIASSLCSLDFGIAATSWFWHISVNIKMLFGFAIYYLIYNFWISKAPE